MRFHGAVGYATSTETSPGVWEDVIIEKLYFGDVIRNTRRLEAPTAVPPMTNSNISVDNSISIVADDHAYASFMNIRYIEWEGQRWAITNVEVRRPRLIFTIGDLWNGNTA